MDELILRRNVKGIVLVFVAIQSDFETVIDLKAGGGKKCTEALHVKE